MLTGADLVSVVRVGADAERSLSGQCLQPVYPLAYICCHFTYLVVNLFFNILELLVVVEVWCVVAGGLCFIFVRQLRHCFL